VPKVGIGVDVAKTELIWNPYQQSFLQALERRTKTGARAFDRLTLFAGRRGGKTRIGAVAAVKEMQHPHTYGWVCAPTYPDLHDFVLPEVMKLIPRSWIADWSQNRLEMQLINKARIAFRSLDDPDRARGPGLDWVWIDEARKVQALAWDVMSPAVVGNAGVAWFTTTPNGFDWCYKQLWKPAVDGERGYWATRYWTEENPIFRLAAQRAGLERDRKMMDPIFFAQEYCADFVTFTGAIYGRTIEPQILRDDDPRLLALFPEWPRINPDRPCYVGIDPGADHPFAAVLLVSTDKGLVQVGEYIQRNKSALEHKRGMFEMLAAWNPSRPFRPENWAIDRSQKQMAIELAQAPFAINCTAAENDVRAGVNRCRGWLETNRLWLIESKCRRTIEQLRGYRWAENVAPSGEYRREEPRKEEDDLPDALRYALMLSPELPDTDNVVSLRQGLELFSDEQKWAVQRMEVITRRERGLDDLGADDDGPGKGLASVNASRAYFNDPDEDDEPLGSGDLWN
jgi:Terminase RNaseH-like domain/Terminase large subunit, T4likevirus-type, N-terminal